MNRVMLGQGGEGNINVDSVQDSSQGLDNASTTARLLITCPDQPGIISAVSTFLYHHGANITDLDQHSSDTQGGKFFLRLEFQTPGLDCSLEALEKNFAARVAKGYQMDWRLTYARDKKRMAIMVSRHDHGLMELLWRTMRGDLPAVIPMVISNHEDLRSEVERFGIAYHYVPVAAETKEQAYAQMADLLEGQADVIVLARYMQILSPTFVQRFPQQIINIHHSFLPAFVGADPYRQAWERGVKLIGATSHYVTDELDQGPIIEQNVHRVSHRHSAAELKALGQDVERNVLLRAVTWHLEDRVIVDGNKTVVFVK